MKKKSLLTLVLAPVFIFLLLAYFSPAFSAAGQPVVIGFIGSFDSDAGKSTLRGAEIAIDLGRCRETGNGLRISDVLPPSFEIGKEEASVLAVVNRRPTASRIQEKDRTADIESIFLAVKLTAKIIARRAPGSG